MLLKAKFADLMSQYAESLRPYRYEAFVITLFDSLIVARDYPNVALGALVVNINSLSNS